MLVNPKSGGGRARPLATETIRQLHMRGHAVSRFESHAPGQIANRVRKVGAAHAALLVVGGDGTIREAIAGDPEGTTPLAILPCGSANVLATELSLPAAPADVARLIDDGYSERFDSGLIQHAVAPSPVGSGRPAAAVFLLMVGAGMDGRVVHRVHRRRHGGTLGKSRYVLPAVRELLGFRPIRHWVTLEDGTREGPFAQVLVTNVGSYGAFWKLPGGVDMQDGALDVLGFRASGRLSMLGHIVRGSGNRLRAGATLFHTRVRRVRVDAEQQSLVQADGDPAGQCPIELASNPASVQLLLPIEARDTKRWTRPRTASTN